MNRPTKTYKIGARGSLLSITQTTLMKEQLEKITGDTFEIVKIVTQGDQIQDKPLWQLEGKDFFTKELDAALLNKEVDLVVHSYKDLGSERPEGIELAAITRREYAHDILLIRNDSLKEISKKDKLIVGTSSPRRIVNITKYLKDYIPFKGNSIECETLRGNVNTRIQKLKDGKYDAIVLALAGLERLALLENSKKELQGLFEDLNFMILPLSVFPSAASQGALAIECLEDRDDQGELKEKLQRLACDKTVQEMKIERARFQSYGGGCHLAVGIHCFSNELGHITFETGEVDGKEVHRRDSSDNFEMKYPLFLGMPSKRFLADKVLSKKPQAYESERPANYFVTTRYVLDELKVNKENSTFWAAGNRTHRELCKQGYWVNGNADFLGQEQIEHLKNSKALELFHGDKPWVTLTNKDSQSFIGEKAIGYERELLETPEGYEWNIDRTQSFYWASFYQYQVFCERFPQIKDRDHYCGCGKTLSDFKENNIAVTPILNLRKYIEKTQG